MDYYENTQEICHSDWWYDQDAAMQEYSLPIDEDDDSRLLEMCVYNNAIIDQIFFKKAS